MVDAIASPIPQQVVVDDSAETAKQPDSTGASFTKVLTDAIGSDSESATKPIADEPENNTDDAQSALCQLAGAMQAAIAMPAQANAPETVTDASPRTGIDSVESVSSSDPRSQSMPVNSISVMSQATETDMLTELASQNTAVIADQSEVVPQVALESDAPVDTADTISATPVSISSNESAVTDDSIKSSTLDYAANITKANASVDGDESAQQSHAATESVDAGNAKPTDASGQVSKSVTIHTVATEAVSVESKLSASNQTPTIAGVESAVKTTVESVAGTGAESTGNDGGETSDQAMSGQQVAMPMGQEFKSQLQSATGNGVNAESVDVSKLQTRVLDQVVREVSLKSSEGRSDIVVKLSPPELGAMRVQLSQDASGISAHIQAESNQVRGLLEAHTPLLIDALAKAGVQIDSVSVSVGTSFNAFAQNSGQQNAQTNSNHAFAQYSPGFGTAQDVGDMPIASLETSSSSIGYSWFA